MIRINKYIASRHGCSRREADRLIAAGKVRVNGEVTEEMGLQVDPDKDDVEVEGYKEVTKDKMYFAFYKPEGVLTAYGEGQGGKKTLDNWPRLARYKLPYSGRLDYDSEGLIILTNDGDLILRLQRAEFKVEKEYHVTTTKELPKGAEEEMRRGLKTEEAEYRPCRAKRTGERRYRVVLTEGKKRQVRMMFRHFGVRVISLKRVRIGPVDLEGLEPGKWRELKDYETEELIRCTE
ncbi:pseudouridine synthase [Limisalsivibrio acetivorans]|uniref:pseudouridine synthase n=1 Tax=Limisalsivibrio acetivorans TaxID=1304888 RepID=UPI0003B4F74D|nr:pseudouridine synthase [Limisalsivibrio acetivorans]